MTALTEHLLTADGVHTLPNIPTGSGRFVLTARGDFGSGTLTPGIIVDDGGTEVFVELTLLTAISADGEIFFECGANTQPAVELTGSTAAAIKISVSGAY